MGFLKREAGGGLFKLYRADVELSCPRTPEPTSDGQWEECPAAGSIMHFQHLETMSVRSTTPSPKNSWLQFYSVRPRLILSAVFLINICVAILASSHFISDTYANGYRFFNERRHGTIFRICWKCILTNGTSTINELLVS